MNKNHYNVVIIGSGFAGINAAEVLKGNGLSVVVIDENPHAGGQLLRTLSDYLGNAIKPRVKKGYIKNMGFDCIKRVDESEIDIRTSTAVVGVFEDNTLMIQCEGKEIEEIKYDVMLIATGARERYLPFKGWTLPGVYSPGMVQVMMKSSGIMPSKDILVGGSGLFLFSMAYEFIRNGGKVHAILEQTGMFDKIKMLPLLPSQFSKFAEGAKFMGRISSAFVPVKYRRKIIEARGDGQVEEVVSAGVDSSGKIVPGSEKVYRTGALAAGYGFVPNIELFLAVGCDTVYEKDLGGFVVKVDDRMETSVENIFGAGEVTGVAGALKSIDEGRIAGYSILHKLGKIDKDEYRNSTSELITRRASHLKFGKLFSGLYSIGGEDVLAIPDDTIVCRCEDVKMSQIKEAIADGFNTPSAIKGALRISMGNCQGRTCTPLISDILSTLVGVKSEEQKTFGVRPPIKPVRIGQFIKDE